MGDKQMEDKIEEGEIRECFHDPVNTKEQEKEDSQEELIINDYDESLFGAQNAHVVNNSNSSSAFKKKDFEKLHKTVFQSIIDSIIKNKNIFNHAGKSCEKKELTNMAAMAQFCHGPGCYWLAPPTTSDGLLGHITPS